MSTVTLEREAEKLENLTDLVVVVRNATGRVLGRFIPDQTRMAREDLEIPFSEEDLRRREQVREGFTTDQVHAYLRSLDVSDG